MMSYHMMSAHVPKLNDVSLSDQVISVIVDRVISGDWQPGARLPSEPELASQFGVSRSVVRDAVRVLVAWGLIEVRRGVGASVTRPTDEAFINATVMMFLRSETTVGDLLRARMLVETAVAGVA